MTPKIEINVREESACKTIAAVSMSIQEAGTTGIIKGGAVRDWIWNCYHGTDFRPRDIDFFVASNIHIVHQQLQNYIATVQENLVQLVFQL